MVSIFSKRAITALINLNSRRYQYILCRVVIHSSRQLSLSSQSSKRRSKNKTVSKSFLSFRRCSQNNNDNKHITNPGMKSFGEIFTKEFQSQVAKSYKSKKHSDGIEKCHSKSLTIFEETEHDVKLEFLRNNYYGQNGMFESPFGLRSLLYCDWTASGKSLDCIERYICTEILPLYANTHTTASITGIQTGKFRSESRAIILESLCGDINNDVIIFCGNGATGAIYKLSNILMKSYRPETVIVFISIYEHNSNILIWKELGCKIIVIPENEKQGGLDLKILEKHLKFYTSSHIAYRYNLLIGSFTAASNITGIMAPIDETTKLLHFYNALSFWDYAAAAPYLDINMTNTHDATLSKDAVFISMHKFLGGVGSPGILCAKRNLFNNTIPEIPGGGTVFVAYGINDGEFEYIENIEEREEGGTPDIIGSIRASFAFMIKDNISVNYIEKIEKEYFQYFLNEIKSNINDSFSNLHVLGNIECERLPIISFLISHYSKLNGKTKYLHYNYISALLNDLFGIQGRGGCACAGLYGQYILNLNSEQMEYFMTQQVRDDKNELARPGYYRINLHYTLKKNELQYILDAIKYVCQHGWKLLPLYDVNCQSGAYFYRKFNYNHKLKSLLHVEFHPKNGQMIWNQQSDFIENNNLNQYFKMADQILLNLNEYLLPESEISFQNEENINDDKAWYWLPSELYQEVKNYANSQ